MPDATTNAYGVSHFDPVGLSMFTVRCNSVTSTCCAIALDTSEKVGTTDLTSAAKQMAVSSKRAMQSSNATARSTSPSTPIHSSYAAQPCNVQ